MSVGLVSGELLLNALCLITVVRHNGGVGKRRIAVGQLLVLKNSTNFVGQVTSTPLQHLVVVRNEFNQDLLRFVKLTKKICSAFQFVAEDPTSIFIVHLRLINCWFFAIL